MSALRHARTLEEISRELDLVVYRLERPSPRDAEGVDLERVRLRKELEQLRDRLTEVVRALEA